MSHVAFVIPGIDRIGGAERQTLLLANGMRRRGWRVTVVALCGDGGAEKAALEENDIEFVSLQMRKGLADPRGWLRFNRWIRRETPDLVHTHLPHATWLTRWSRVLAPMRVLVDTLHSSSTGRVGRRLGYRWSDWLSDQVTAVSEGVGEAHLRSRMVAQGRLAVLPNGVDVETWTPDAAMRDRVRREFGVDSQFLWLAAGRLDAVKDYPTLLRAFADVPQNAQLVIAGGGPCETALRSLASALSLDQRVRFLGFEPHALPWMQAADAFVLSSRWEGLPIGLLEAGACALPAAATDVAGTREVIVDGQTGILAAPGDAFSLQRAMAHIMGLSAAERGAMGQQARARVAERFSLDAVLDRWEALYEMLLERHPTPRRCGAIC